MTFVTAVSRGDLQEAKRLYNKNIDINKQYQLGQTLLYHACFKGYTDIVEFLLISGANMMICDNNGNFPIHTACNKGQIKVIEKLIQFGANVNLLSRKNLSPLQFALHGNQLETMHLLLQSGAFVNGRSKNNLSYLYFACKLGNLKMVELLVEHGALVNIPGRKGLGDSPIHIASNKGFYKVVSYLIEHGADLALKDECISALYTAVYNKRIEVVDILLDAGANVNFTDTQVFQTPLHVAAYMSRLDIAMRLVDRGANVNAADKNGLTPLHLASVKNNIDCVKYLLACGADPTIVSNKGNTPFKVAPSKEMKTILEVDSEKVATPSAPSFDELDDNSFPIAGNDVCLLTLEQQLEAKEKEFEKLKMQMSEVEDEIQSIKTKIETRDAETSAVAQGFACSTNHLECPICLEIPFPPTKIFQCEQGHIFCEICRKGGLTYCPECRVKLSDKVIRNRRLENVIAAMSDVKN